MVCDVRQTDQKGCGVVRTCEGVQWSPTSSTIDDRRSTQSYRPMIRPSIIRAISKVSSRRYDCKRILRSFSLKSEEPFYGSPRPQHDCFQPSPHHHHSTSWVIPTTTALQRLGVAIHSATTALSDPKRADAVAALGEITGYMALRTCYDTMMSHETGQRILRDRPLIHSSHIDLEALSRPKSRTDTHPNGQDRLTFGQAYVNFLKSHQFHPDDRSPIRYIADPDLAYIMLRYRQCHDFWHTLSGLPPTVLGEIALKWVELIQTGLPVAALSATVGSLRLDPEQRHILWDTYLPWAIRVGQQATFLMNVYYEEEFDTDLQELRLKLNFEAAPVVSMDYHHSC